MAAGFTKTHPVRALKPVSPSPLDASSWPANIPAVASILRNGLELSQATIFTGDNGSGKSTLVEAIAIAFGLNPEGGSTGANHQSRETESALHDAITLQCSPNSRRGYFLRAETMHAFYTYLESNDPEHRDPLFHEMSHGESFNAILDKRFKGAGLFVMDEPESALSFTGCLALVIRLVELLKNPGAQVLIATHSPIVAALPGALVYELDDSGMHERQWANLTLVQQHRSFFEEPEDFLRYVLRDE